MLLVILNTQLTDHYLRDARKPQLFSVGPCAAPMGLNFFFFSFEWILFVLLFNIICLCICFYFLLFAFCFVCFCLLFVYCWLQCVFVLIYLFCDLFVLFDLLFYLSFIFFAFSFLFFFICSSSLFFSVGPPAPPYACQVWQAQTRQILLFTNGYLSGKCFNLCFFF